ncbi:MAG: hypothetical protein O3A92_02910 [Verrucomicrobia bacterium]|nr:hypothetical protein [Verrucomicrobiota bacterium]
MDDSLKALEARLERLVPKGLSDLGRERMEDRIDELAATVESGSDLSGWKWGMGAAAAVVALVAAFWSTGREGAETAVVEVPAVEIAKPAEVVAMRTEEDLMELLTLSLTRHVEARTDRGFVTAEGGEAPHRYWSYEVTNDEELMDSESGYAVRVVSQHEEWVPVAVTSL